MFGPVYVLAPTQIKKGKIEDMKWYTLCLLITLSLPLQAGVNRDVRQGSKLYQNGKYGQALTKFEHALQTDPHHAAASFGAGASAYYLKEYDLAARNFENITQQPSALQQDAWFNLGNTYYRAHENQQAISAYKQAILQNPQDKEAIHNLQLVLREQQNQQNKNNQNQQNQDNNSQNQDNQDNPDNKSQNPHDKQEQNPSQNQRRQAQEQQAKQAADRVLQLARDSEYKKPTHSARNPDQEQVEKDW